MPFPFLIFYIFTIHLIYIILRLIPRLVPTFSPTAIRALIRSSTLSSRHLSRWIKQKCIEHIQEHEKFIRVGNLLFLFFKSTYFIYEIPRRAFLTCFPVWSQLQDLELRRQLSWPKYPPTSNIILTIILTKISSNK